MGEKKPEKLKTKEGPKPKEAHIPAKTSEAPETPEVPEAPQTAEAVRRAAREARRELEQEVDAKKPEGTLNEEKVKTSEGENFVEKFTKTLDKILGSIFAFLEKFLGKDRFQQTFNAETQTVNPEKLETDKNLRDAVQKAGMNRLDENGKRLAVIWPPREKVGKKSLVCQISRTEDGYLTDNNGLQSLGHFQFNGALLRQYFDYVRKNDPRLIDALSLSARKKVISIADHGQSKNDHSNFLTDEEGYETAEKIFMANPSLEWNFRGEAFFDRQLKPQIAILKREFPHLHAVVNRMQEDQRYLAVMLDLFNQCGATGGTRVLRQALQSLDASDTSPRRMVELLTRASDDIFGKRRAVRTFRAFIMASGTEYGIRRKEIERLIDLFFASTEEEQHRLLTELEKKKTEGTLKV